MSSVFSYAHKVIYFNNLNGTNDSLHIEEVLYKYFISKDTFLLCANLYGDKEGVILLFHRNSNVNNNVLIDKVETAQIININFHQFDNIQILNLELHVHDFCADEKFYDYYLIDQINNKIITLSYTLVESLVDVENKLCVSDHGYLVKYCQLVYKDSKLFLKCQCYKDDVRYDEEKILLEK